MLTKTLILLSIIILIGCSSGPREVTPSLSLVPVSQEKPNKKEVPIKYWKGLANPLQSEIQHEKYNVKLSSLYTSALGMLCRELIITDTNNKAEKRIACEISFINKNNKQDKAWFIEKQIIESSSYVEL